MSGSADDSGSYSRLSGAERAAAQLRTPSALTTGIVDVHHHDGACDLEAFVAGGGVAMIHKATEGGTFVDPRFAATLPTLKPAGVMAGAYHFANATDPIKQAEHFLRTVEPFPGTLLALDCESNDRSKFGTMSFEQAAVFVKHVHERTGRWPVFYTYDSMLRSGMERASAEVRSVLGRCPLWLAKYGPAPKELPAKWGAWPDWSLWQYTSSLENGPADQKAYPRGVPGFARKAQDRNVFRGTPDELAAWWKTAGL